MRTDGKCEVLGCENEAKLYGTTHWWNGKEWVKYPKGKYGFYMTLCNFHNRYPYSRLVKGKGYEA